MFLVFAALLAVADAAVYLLVSGWAEPTSGPYQSYLAFGDSTPSLSQYLPRCVASASERNVRLESVNTSTAISRVANSTSPGRHIFLLWNFARFLTLTPSLTGTMWCVSDSIHSRLLYNLHVVMPLTLTCDRSREVVHGRWATIATTCVAGGYPLPSVRWQKHAFSAGSESSTSTVPVYAGGLYSFNTTFVYTIGNGTDPAALPFAYQVTAMASYTSDPCSVGSISRCKQLIASVAHAHFHGVVVGEVTSPVTSLSTSSTSSVATSPGMPQTTTGPGAWLWISAVVSTVFSLFLFATVVVYRRRRNICQKAALKDSIGSESTIQDDTMLGKVLEASVERAAVVTSSA